MSLYIGNISEAVTKTLLQTEFSRFGQCDISFFVSITQGKFAFIEYKSMTEAKNALLSLNGRHFNGSIIHIEISKQVHKPETYDLINISVHSPDLKCESISTPSDILQSSLSPREVYFPANQIFQSEKQSSLQFNTYFEGLYDGDAKDEREFKNAEVQTSPKYEGVVEFEEVKVEASPKKKSNRGRKKKNEIYINPVQNISDELVEGYGELFEVVKINKKFDDNSLVKCPVCERVFRKKSIRSHLISIMHSNIKTNFASNES